MSNLLGLTRGVGIIMKAAESVVALSSLNVHSFSSTGPFTFNKRHMMTF